MKKIKAALLGAGGRGSFAYGTFALNHVNEIEFTAVAEPDKQRRELFARLHNVPSENVFNSWEQLLEKPKLAEAILICTQDKMHYEPAIKALEKGYHVLLEKPMSTDPEECIMLGKYAEKHNRILNICHVLRYTNFFKELKKLLKEDRIGKLVSVQHNENVAHWHYAHSYVRGMWSNSDTSGPMILTKSCHDMDILLWLADADCINIASFGSLTRFKKENAPEGAPARCDEGCPAEDQCPYYAPRTYLVDDRRFDPFQFMLCTDQSLESRAKELKKSRYGRCVYACDNNIVDSQAVLMEFANGVTASFIMCAYTQECSRTIKLMGINGEIRGNLEKNEIEILDFLSGSTQVIKLKEPVSGHNGGDEGIMKDFIKLVGQGSGSDSATSAKVSIQSHIMAFAAEKARVEKRIININEYINEISNT